GAGFTGLCSLHLRLDWAPERRCDSASSAFEFSSLDAGTTWIHEPGRAARGNNSFVRHIGIGELAAPAVWWQDCVGSARSSGGRRRTAPSHKAARSHGNAGHTSYLAAYDRCWLE